MRGAETGWYREGQARPCLQADGNFPTEGAAGDEGGRQLKEQTGGRGPRAQGRGKVLPASGVDGRTDAGREVDLLMTR